MQGFILQLFAYVRGTWRHRWSLLVTAWIACVLGWIGVANMPDQFEASARVFVDTQSLLKPLLRGLAIQTNEQRRITLMTKTLLSRPNLEKVARMTDLDLQAKTPEEMESLLDDLADDIKLRGTDRDNLYTLSYADKDPELAKLVVKSLLTIFVESNLGETRREQDSASQFIEQQIDEYEQRMAEAEKKLALFKQKNLGFLSSESGDYYAQLRDAQGRLKQAKLDLKMQQDRLQVLKEQLKDEEETPSFGLGERGPSAGMPSELDTRIAALEARLDELLLLYTDQHPDVVGTRRTIETLKARQAEEAAAQEDALDAGGAETSAIYQQMKLVYSEAEAEVAAKKVVVAEYSNRVKNLGAAIDRVLQVEAEQSQLNRDYGTLKKNYSTLVARLESARLSRKADTRVDSVRFRVIDPPRVPLEPSAPNRILLSSGVLGIGLGIGIALAFLLSQIRPTFDDRRLMNEIMGLPVLGSVDMVWTAVQKRRRLLRSVAFSLTFLGLVTVYGGVMSIYLLDVDVGSHVNVELLSGITDA